MHGCYVVLLVLFVKINMTFSYSLHSWVSISGFSEAYYDHQRNSANYLYIKNWASLKKNGKVIFLNNCVAYIAVYAMLLCIVIQEAANVQVMIIIRGVARLYLMVEHTFYNTLHL